MIHNSVIALSVIFGATAILTLVFVKGISKAICMAILLYLSALAFISDELFRIGMVLFCVAHIVMGLGFLVYNMNLGGLLIFCLLGSPYIGLSFNYNRGKPEYQNIARIINNDDKVVWVDTSMHCSEIDTCHECFTTSDRLPPTRFSVCQVCGHRWINHIESEKLISQEQYNQLVLKHLKILNTTYD